MTDKNESISEKLNAVYKWLYTNKEEIMDSGHDIMFVDMSRPNEDMVSGAVICGVDDQQLASVTYEILKHRFHSSEEHTLLKVYMLEFVKELQRNYELDYADTDTETIEQAVQMMETVVSEHADKFHELFDDDDDPELADNVNHALHTISEIGEFFDIGLEVREDYDDFDLDDEEEDEEELDEDE